MLFRSIQSSNSASAAWTLTLPTTAGTNGYLLSTNGSGVSSWFNLFGTANSFTASQTFNAATSSIYLGANGGNLGVATLYGSTSGSVQLKPAAVAGTGTIFQLPSSNGTANYALLTDGSGLTSWGQISLSSSVTGTLPVANGGTGTSTAFTAGSVLFAGASGVYSQNNSAFFWDNTNSRLGVGFNSPSYTLDVNGYARATGYYISLVDNHWLYSAGATDVVLRIGASGPYYLLGTTGGNNLRLDNASGGGLVFTNAGTLCIAMDGNKNLYVGSSAVGTSAANVISIANGTAPTTSPAGLGQLYVEGGALKYRGSAGTVTTIAAA